MRYRNVLLVGLLLASFTGCKDKKDKEAGSAKVEAAPPPQTPPATPPPAAAPPAEASAIDAGLFTVPKAKYTKGEDVVIAYKQPVTQEGTQRHWITLAKPGDVESAWGIWHYVPAGATVDKLQPPTTGQWEIRFHDVYPKWAGGRIMAKAVITVE